MKRPRSLFKYYDDRRWADGLMEGRLRFQTLARFRNWEEQQVRGDRHEGTSLFAPEQGLEVTNFTQRRKFVMPAHRFASAAKQDEIFVFCLSRTLARRLWDGFGAVACVEILDVPAFGTRVTAGLPTPFHLQGKPGRQRIGGRVDYYRASDPPGARWALPDLIALSKVEDYRWQDEFRLLFSQTDALGFENVSLSLAPPETATPKQPASREPFDLAIAALWGICRLHALRPAD